MGAWPSLRQLTYPREFRISPPSVDDRWLPAWSELVSRVVTDRVAARDTPSAPGLGVFTDEAVADLGTGIWRVRQRMLEPETGRPKESMRRAFRHLEAVWDLLHGLGIEVQDHTDDPFDSGMSLKVLAFQPEIGVSSEKVMETVKPSIYSGGRRIQMGEVIVATPRSDVPSNEPH